MGQAEARIGQLLGGKYRLDQLLARGGMGVVYGARHEGTGRAVAAKLLRPELMVHSDLVRRVPVEARLAVEAAHPNVVEVLDMGEDVDGIPYLILERLHGFTLEEALARPLSLFTTLQALVPVANALVALHRAGIVHRDIKPSNLFLSVTSDGRITPKLLDFGIAQALAGSGAKASGLMLGTPAYMAPEQALGEDAVTHACDIFSLAVVISRCLTGRLLQESGARDGTQASNEAMSSAGSRALPEPVAVELSRALQVQPAARFARMSDFRDALLRACAQLEPERAWPGPATVSYGFGETALADWLGPAQERALGGRAADPPACGRELLVQTRTLVPTSVRVASGSRRAGWLWLVALVGIGLGLLGLQSLLGEQKRVARAAAFDLLVPERAPVVALDEVVPTVAEPAAQRVVTLSGKQEPRAASPRSVSTRQGSSVPGRSEPQGQPVVRGPLRVSRQRTQPTTSGATQASGGVPPPTWVGANRSPIID